LIDGFVRVGLELFEACFWFMLLLSQGAAMLMTAGGV
jgi:hypothetical protein